MPQMIYNTKSERGDLSTDCYSELKMLLIRSTGLYVEPWEIFGMPAPRDRISIIFRSTSKIKTRRRNQVLYA